MDLRYERIGVHVVKLTELKFKLSSNLIGTTAGPRHEERTS